MLLTDSVAAKPGNMTVYVLAYLIAPNLSVWLFEGKLWLSPHGYLNVECLLVGILALFLPRAPVFVLLSVEMLFSFVYLICYTYQFSLETLFASLHYLSLLPPARLSSALPALALTLVLSALVAFAVPKPSAHLRRRTAASLAAVGVLLIALDTLDGRNPVWPTDSARGLPRLAMSPVAALTKRAFLFHLVEASERTATDRNMRSASAEGIGFLNNGSRLEFPNVVLVLVESWGLPLDTSLANAIESGYGDPSIQKAYRVDFGTAPFGGLTVPGEARELCHSGLGFGIMNLSGDEKDRCLPAVFHQHGYENIAIHGYVGGMFQRETWYRFIGFDQLWFKPDLSRAGLPECDGAFPGICDGAIGDWIGDTLRSGNEDRPKFIYWVTLNSHLPVPRNPNLPEDSACSLNPELERSNSLCSWFRIVSAVQRSVQKVALEPRKRDTVFILVGDHAPPFPDPRLRAMFSNTDVPYVILTPRALTN